MSSEADSKRELDKFITKKKREGISKLKMFAFITAACKCFDNTVDFNKTFDAVFDREILKTAKQKAIKMGATKDQIAQYDAVIKIHDDLLLSFKEVEGDAKI